MNLGICIKCKTPLTPQSQGQFFFSRMRMTDEGDFEIEGSYCPNCLDPFWDLQKAENKTRDRLLSLEDEISRKQGFLDEAKKRIDAGGPLALSEFIIVKEGARDGKLWLKVIDVTKGYWAEAPLEPKALTLLTMRKEARELK